MRNIITVKKNDLDFIRCYEKYKKEYTPSRSDKERKCQQNKIMHGALVKYFKLKGIKRLPAAVKELKCCYHVSLHKYCFNKEG